MTINYRNDGDVRAKAPKRLANVIHALKRAVIIDYLKCTATVFLGVW
jgi:hypothetical protein